MTATALTQHAGLPDEWLLDHAAGAAPEPVAAFVEAHLALSAPARATYARLTAVGGVLLDRQTPADLAPDALERMLKRLDETPAAAAAVPAPHPVVPGPLLAYTGGDLDALPWTRIVKGVEVAPLPLRHTGPYKMSLVRIAGGKAIPRHTHMGDELLLVLDGAFEDGRGHYKRGDVCFADDAVDHAPSADRATDCLCLFVADAPIKLTGPIGRWLNPILRLAGA